jgi:hypothetical protein
VRAAQVTVEVALDQDQFLPSEMLPVAVKITNQSGQPLHLGADANWLTFSVESADGSSWSKMRRCRWGEFDLDSSQDGDQAGGFGAVFCFVQAGALSRHRNLRIKDWSRRWRVRRKVST